MNKSESIKYLAMALNKAQAEIGKAHLDATNPFFKSKYATLSSVWDACREALEKNGLSILQTMGSIASDSKEVPVLMTTLLHTTGEYIRGYQQLNPEKDTPQGMGSAITYARRYGLASMVGVCPEDDDAEGTVDRKKSKKEDVVSKRSTPVVPDFIPLETILKGIKEGDLDDLAKYWLSIQDQIKSFPKDDQKIIEEAKDKRKAELKEAK